MKNLDRVTEAGLLVVGVVAGLVINYPAMGSQAEILARFGSGQYAAIGLWMIRVISLELLYYSLKLWQGVCEVSFSKRVAIIGNLVLLASPLFFTWWYFYPVSCLKLGGLIVVIKYMGGKTKLVGVGVAVTYLVLFSYFENSDKAAIFHKLDLGDAVKETTERFSREDGLTSRIPIPLVLRRAANNKFTIEYKQVINQIIPFFDLETWFFGEVSPMEQKSPVIFYWIESILFLWGLVVLGLTRNRQRVRFVAMVFGLALVNYLFSAREVFLRMGVVMLPVSLIIALGLDELARSYKMVFIAAITLIAYGVETNFLDMAQRPDYWFDNRPLVYDFWYRSIKLVDSGGEKKVLVSSLLGSGEAYCRLYLGERCREGVIYTGFDLSKSDVKSGAIYVGFEGEFLGADDRNEFKDDWRGLVNSRGLRIVAAREIRDTVAYRYGNYIIVAVNDD